MKKWWKRKLFVIPLTLALLGGGGLLAHRETAIHCLAIRIDGTPLPRWPEDASLERAAERYARKAIADHDSGVKSICQPIRGWGRWRALKRWSRQVMYLEDEKKYIVAMQVARDAWSGNYKYPDPALEPRKGFWGRVKDRVQKILSP